MNADNPRDHCSLSRQVGTPCGTHSALTGLLCSGHALLDSCRPDYGSEQAGNLPFNRGFVNDAGFQAIAPDVDYVCFHDVDLLPEEADYRLSERPAMAISDGLNSSF